MAAASYSSTTNPVLEHQEMSGHNPNTTEGCTRLDWIVFITFLALLILSASVVPEQNTFLMVSVLATTIAAGFLGFHLFGFKGLKAGVIHGVTAGATIGTGLPLLSITTTLAIGLIGNWPNGWIWGMRVSLYGATTIYALAAVFMLLGSLGFEFGPQG
ncbi:MAG: hypothetical protein AAF412_12715 [Pseudomonadota bacterium]